MKHRFSWTRRVVSILLIEAHILTCCPPNVWAATAAQTNRIAGRGAEGPKSKSEPPAPRLSGPKAAPKPIDLQPVFSEQPLDAEFFSAHIFDEPLVPTGPTTPEENKALAAALLEFASRQTQEDLSSVTAFVHAWPASEWRASLLLNLGIIWRHTGYFSRALEAWEEAWVLARGQSSVRARAMADRILGELTQINAWVGRYSRLEPLFEEVKARPVSGSAAERVQAAKLGLWMMKTDPGVSFKCGPYALHQIELAENPNAKDANMMAAKSSTNGFSLSQLQDLAHQWGLKYRMARRKPGSEIPVKGVVHWKLNHFGAILKSENDRYFVQDSTFSLLHGQTLWLSKAAIDEESSGYFLIPEGPLPEGWEAATIDEGSRIWGKGATCCQNPDDFSEDDQKNCPDDDGDDSDAANDDSDSDDDSVGMPHAQAHLMMVSLNIVDKPLRYRPARGPRVAFKATYNQRDGLMPNNFNYSNLGIFWTFNWISYVIDTGSTPDPAAAIKRYLSGGGALTSPAPQGYNSLPFTYPADQRGNILSRTDADRYELTRPDGSKLVYAQPGSLAAGQRKVFLSQIIDPYGNTVTIHFIGAGQPNVGAIDYIEDATGQRTHFHYDLAADSYKITSIVDPFGRSAVFAYDQQLRLQTITDQIGMSSSFNYHTDPDKNGFITRMTTPYGSSSFGFGERTDTLVYPGITTVPTLRRWLDMTNPAGETERIIFQHAKDILSWNDPDGVPSFTQPANVPGPTFFVNNYLDLRNTFHFGRKATHDHPEILASDPGNFDVVNLSQYATTYHWLHDYSQGGAYAYTSGILESIKPPLESRIWFLYPGQSSPDTYKNLGITLRKPAVIARYVGDGANKVAQVSYISYNSQGRMASYKDPLGRETTYDYYANGIDLQKVRQTKPGTSETLLEFGPYDLGAPNGTTGAPHRPSTIIDTSRQTTTLEWDRQTGKLTKLTNPKSEVTHFSYFTDAASVKTFLHTVDQDWSGATKTTTFTWDGVGRLRTAMDSEGYTLTYDYDNLDRLTKITYPDLTFELFGYDRLNLYRFQDRRGRRTIRTFDGVGRILTEKDPANRITQYAWCGCGGLESIIDPQMHTTTWLRDIQGRVTEKHFHDGKIIHYTYESRTSRLLALRDAKDQIKTFSYYADNLLASIVHTHVTMPAPTGIILAPDVSFTYDPKYPRVATMTDGNADGNGQTVYNYYPVSDPGTLGAGKLSSIDGPLANATVLNDTVTFTYDELGRVVSRTLQPDANGTRNEAFGYDALGRVTSHGTRMGSFTPAYLNATPRLSSVAFPNGQATAFAYLDNTHDQRLSDIQNQHVGGNGTVSWSTGYFSWFLYSYDQEGMLRHQSRIQDNPGSLLDDAAEYDNADQLISLSISDVNSDVILHTYTYGYDPAGNRTSEQHDSRWGDGSAPWTKVTTSSYNSLNEINARSGSGPLPVRFVGLLNEAATVTINGQPTTTEHMQPDELGYTPAARIFKGTVNLNPSPNDQTVTIQATDYGAGAGNIGTMIDHLTVLGGEAKTFAHDSNGNCATNGSAVYSWDSEDRLVAIVNGNVRTDITYDGFGRWVKMVETTNGVSLQKRFIWSGTELLMERDGLDVLQSGGTAAFKYFYPEGVFVGNMTRDGDQFGVEIASYFYAKDRLGNIREMTDSAGNIRARYDYDPYGRRTKVQGDLDSDFGFTGLYYHPPSSLNLAAFRAYDADIGRWINRDPIDEAGGLNLYHYAGNDPINFLDSLGLWIYPSDFVGPLLPGDVRMPVAPPGASTDENMYEAFNHFPNPWWFYNQVKNHAPWDYKQRGRQYQDFGNFNYGACGKAFGFPEDYLFREAGRAQQAAGTSNPEWGDPGWRANPFGGSGFYGDDPQDRYWIERGIEYYKQTHPPIISTDWGFP